MADFANYSPDKITIVLGNILVGGYADGTFVKVTRDSESFKDEVGAGGDVVRVKNLDKRGSIVITVQSSSPTNDLLSALLIADEASGSAHVPVLVKDLIGTTLCGAENAWLLKPADIEYGNEASSREWTIRCADLDILVGGALT